MKYFLFLHLFSLVIARGVIIENLSNNGGFYFKNIGMSKVVDGHVSIINSLNLENIEQSIDTINLQINNVDKACLKHFDACTSLVKKGHRNHEKLVDKMTNIYSLLGKKKHRFRRGLINVVGSGLKVLFGTMDREDAEYYNNALMIEKENQEFLRNGLKEEVNIMSSLNEQNQVLLKNYHILENKTLYVINSIDNIIVQTNELQEKEGMLEYFQRLYDSIIEKSLELEIELDKIIDAILFLQLKIIHPFIMTPEKLIMVLNKSKYEGRMLYTPSLESYHNIVKLLKIKIFEKNNNICICNCIFAYIKRRI